MSSVAPPSMKATADNHFVPFFCADAILLSAVGAVGLLTVIIHHFRCNSALLQMPHHGKHGACSDYHDSYEHCKHLAHYPAVCAEPEPAKAGEEATEAGDKSDEDMDTDLRAPASWTSW
ncbi:hypothetical protein UY3_12908 [Chelonia mydas]|uniref:Uncharacterized protein n=1 Tax=Chelonia mydas TaxID=8469 RepID=M7AZ05_CHEMY|nr:hypothetical protein UY3_12908 [Chelonia mydas]